jgi:hypothetical protein
MMLCIDMGCLILTSFYVALSEGHRPKTYCSHGFQPVDDWSKDHKSAIGTAHVLLSIRVFSICLNNLYAPIICIEPTVLNRFPRFFNGLKPVATRLAEATPLIGVEEVLMCRHIPLK